MDAPQYPVALWLVPSAKIAEQTPGALKTPSHGEYTSVYFVDSKAANLTLPRVDDLRAYGLEMGGPSFEKGNTTLGDRD
ncbi:hypothetical protein RM533_12300 [Croceicoccus sp. F390]|uniref:Uncharacterized protein n=1 Tax=Croceicoccus esteveae TaxID=3075597 RepID=A0ABU2ZK26_9SPHN|nr:hypothetical protein [Croceicoccus sp. F390]MDT0576950.1 hypothetical protein [Croceicoccus sp. F390]